MPSPHQDLSAARAESLKTLETRVLDVLIIGGGIVGAGVARDAALRGLRTALVEQHDFAYGTSSRSSRLLHGGLRYLAQGRIGLVREASIEKTILHKIAPHLAEPLPFLFPTYSDNKDWKLWQLKIGVKIYDLLCGGRNLGKSSALSPSDLSLKVPGLKTSGLGGAVRYYDGFTNDARLVFDTLRSASNAGATLLNYCRFKEAGRARHSVSAGLVPANGGARGVTHPARTDSSEDLWNCELTDTLSGKTFSVTARTVVNATGPWADGLSHSSVKLRVTKGIHVVVERARLSVPETVVMTEGKRILFAIPWGDRTILGTTDTDFCGRPEDVSVEASDIRYILGIANSFFPAATLSDADIVSSWAGLRPLLADPNGKPSDISRSHEITSPQPGWWDVAGGKLTTYRLMAEQTVDGIVTWLDQTMVSGGSVASSRTAIQPLLPFFETQNVSGILPPEFCRHVTEHYCAKEWAVHLDDVMIRRTSWHYYHRDTAAKAEYVANWMAELLGWSDKQRDRELSRYCALVDCQSFREKISSDSIAR